MLNLNLNVKVYQGFEKKKNQTFWVHVVFVAEYVKIEENRKKEEEEKQKQEQHVREQQQKSNGRERERERVPIWNFLSHCHIAKINSFYEEFSCFFR